MRLTDEQIKACILHPDFPVRQMAARYYSDAYSVDPDVMPLVIQAVERYGRADSAWMLANLTHLQHSPQTIDWLIRELSAGEKIEDEGDDELYRDALSDCLIAADLDLLVAREDDLLGKTLLSEKYLTAVTQRLQLRNCDQATAWRMLDDFCEANKAEFDGSLEKLSEGRRIVEVLARQPDLDRERVLSILSEEVSDYTNNPMAWKEWLAVILAGEAKIEAAVPLLLDKMSQDDDYVPESCGAALARIGTEEILAEVGRRFTDEHENFKWASLDIFEGVHSESCLRLGIELLNNEPVDDIQIQLAYAVASQFDTAGIEAAATVFRRYDITWQTVDLAERLVVACTALNYKIADLKYWQQTIADGPSSGGLWSDDEDEDFDDDWDHYDKTLSPLMIPTSLLPPAPREPFPNLLNAPASHKQKIGRNDPCPCGSGKKFKACCLGK